MKLTEMEIGYIYLAEHFKTEYHAVYFKRLSKDEYIKFGYCCSFHKHGVNQIRHIGFLEGLSGLDANSDLPLILDLPRTFRSMEKEGRNGNSSK